MVDVGRVSDASLVLAGPIASSFEGTVRRTITELGLDGRVELLGPIEHDRMPAQIAAATVCVAPAASELAPWVTTMFPTRILEYLACRRAVVAPSRGTVNALLRHNVEGLLFAPGDPGDLARKLVRLLTDEALRRRLAQAGYELVRRDHTASNARRAIRRAYAELTLRSPWRERFAERAGTTELRPVTESDHFELNLADDEATEIAASPEPYLTGEGGLPDRSDPAGSLGPLAVGGTVVAFDRPAANDSGHWTSMDVGLTAVADDDWVVSDAAERRRSWHEVGEDEGTPLDVAAAPAAESTGRHFAAGEIDVPTPSPEMLEREDAFTAVGVLLGPGTGEPGSS